MADYKMIDILLVEDNPHDAELTLRAFRKYNLASKVFVVEDGAAALDFLFCRGQYEDRSFENPPKVILLDLKLPKVNGLEVLQELKSHPVTKTFPVVMVTSSREDRDIKRAYELGVNSYLVKPMNFEEFFLAMFEAGHYWTNRNQATMS